MLLNPFSSPLSVCLAQLISGPSMLVLISANLFPLALCVYAIRSSKPSSSHWSSAAVYDHLFHHVK